MRVYEGSKTYDRRESDDCLAASKFVRILQTCRKIGLDMLRLLHGFTNSYGCHVDTM